MGFRLRSDHASTISVTFIVTAVSLVSAGYLFNCIDGESSESSDSESLESVESVLFNQPSDSVEGRYRNAAVAADAEECSQIGTRMMERHGGSAIDAAIAVMLCDGIHNSQSCGIGGGHFLTYYNKATRTAYSVIGREQAPSAATEDMFVPEDVSSTEGGKAIGIPGEIRGLYEAHKLGGRLPWKRLFRPAIKLSRDGFVVRRALAEQIVNLEEKILATPNLREMLTNPVTNQLYKEGETMTRPKLARTLEVIAEEGPDAFYSGSLSGDIVLDIQEADGIITESDLMNYSAVIKSALNIELHDGSNVFSPPPPSGGAVFLYILNILNGYNFTPRYGRSVKKFALLWHRIVEAFKHAFAERSKLGDPDVGSAEFKQFITEVVGNLTSPEFAEETRSAIFDDRTFPPSYYNPSFEQGTDQGTCHISVLGSNGDAVSITGSINLRFGSKVVGSRTGIIFNDEMDDFSTPNTTNSFGVPASPTNFISPWKRPMSSMSPSIAVGSDGNVKLVVGASGGTKIPTAMTAVTVATLWLKWGIKEAVDHPRLHHQLFPTHIQLEDTFHEIIQEKLRQKGHNITSLSSFSAVQGILKQGGRITANSDFRKGGAPDGF